MKIEFYREPEVDISLVNEVIRTLKDLPVVKIKFGELYDIKIDGDIISSELNPQLNSMMYENHWADAYYKKLKLQDNDNNILIHFHNSNPENWYSHIGYYFIEEFPFSDDSPFKDIPEHILKQKFITINVNEDRWQGLPVNHAIVAEILSQILIALATENNEEYLGLANDTNYGGINNAMWEDKYANDGELQNRLMYLKLKIGDIDNNLKELIKQKNVDLYIVRDIVQGLTVLRNAHSELKSEGWDEFLPSDILVDFPNKRIEFTDIGRSVVMTSKPFTLFCAFLIAKLNNVVKFNYPKIHKCADTIENIYNRLEPGTIENIFSDTNTGNSAFRTLKGRIIQNILKGIHPNAGEFADFYDFDYKDEGRFKTDFKIIFTQESKHILRGTGPGVLPYVNDKSNYLRYPDSWR